MPYNNTLPGTTVVTTAAPNSIDMAPDDAPQGIDLYPDVGNPVSDDIAAHRAQKYNYGLNNTSPGEDHLKYDVISGSEPHQRQYQMNMRLIEEEQLKTKMLQEYASSGVNDPEAYQAIVNATSDQLSNPETFYEKVYARRLMNDVALSDTELLDVDGIIVNDSTYADAMEEDPENTQKVLDVSENIKARQELVLKELQDMNGRWEQAGLGSTISNHLEQFMPGFSWYNMSNASSSDGSIMLGDNMREQYENLYLLPTDQFFETVKATAAAIEQENPLDAMMWLQGLISYTGTDQFLNNAVSVLDATTPLPVVGVIPFKAYVRAGTATARLASATKNAIKASTTKSVTQPVQVLAATGNVGKAGLQQAIKELTPKAEATGSAQTLDDVLSKTPTISNPDQFFQDIGNLPRETADRLVDMAYMDAERLLREGFIDNVQVSRLGDLAEDAALENAKRLINYNYGHGGDIVVDIKPVGPADVRLGNINTADVIVGTNEGITNAIEKPKGGVSRFAFEEDDPGNLKGGEKFYAISDKNSKSPVAEAYIRINGDTAFVEDIYSKGPNVLGTSAMRSMLKDFLRDNPAVKKISGVRLTGARGAAGKEATPVIDVSKLDLNTVGTQANILVGRKEADFFASAEQALRANEMFYGFVNPEVIDVGGKFALKIKAPVSEVNQATRDALAVQTANVKQPESLATMFLPYLRSAKNLVDKDTAARTDMALMGGQQLAHVAQKILEPIGKLSENEWQGLNRFMNAERDYAPKQGLRGKFAPTIGAFQRDYLTLHKVLPTVKQQEAYAALRRINDFGYLNTNVALVRDKSRLGFQQFSFGKGAGKPSIEGKLVTADDVFKSVEDCGITIMDDATPGMGTTYRKAWLGGTDKKTGAKRPTKAELQEMMASGQYKIVQLTSQGQRAFRETYPEVGGVDHTFILSKNTASAPLDLQQIPHRPGWHVEMDDGFYISQANIARISDDNAKTTIYYGDRNAYHFIEESKGKEFLKNFEYARQLLKDKKINELKVFLKSKKGLPHTPAEFLKMFNKKQKQHFDVNEPFSLRSKNVSLEKQYKLSERPDNPNWINKKESDYNLERGGLNLQWAGERGDHIYTVINEGDTINPAWKYRPARQVDALTTTQRAANSAMRGRYIDDFKHAAAERFVAQYSDVLANSAEELRANPFIAISNPQWKAGANVPKEAMGKAHVMALRNFLGMKNETGRAADALKARIWQNMLQLHGEKGAYEQMKVLDWVDGWMFGAIKDPLKAMRALAFTEKMGMFNPAQLFLQAQTMAHAVGVAGPLNGAKGISGAYAHRAMLMMPQHAQTIAKKYGIGWKGAEIAESFEWAQRTGWYRIGREVGVLDDYTEVVGHAPGFRGKVSRAIDKGAMFFREGERWTRMTAWNAAYQEWKQKNVGKLMDGAAAQEILARANLMSGDMLASSNAAWQKGVLGIPTQFWAYQSRIMEQLWSKRLTPKEKISVTLTYSLIYGIPVAGGAWAGFWPIHESVREMALANGYEPEGALSFLDKGLGNVVSELITGTEFAVSERFGPGGLPFIEDILSGDTGILEAFGGVGGTALADNMKSLYPFAYSVYSLFDPESELYPVTTYDLLDLARDTSTGNSVYNMMAAYNLVAAVTKNGVPTDKLEGWESIIQLFGPQVARGGDAYRILENEKARKEFEKEGINEVSLELRRASDPHLSVHDRAAHAKRAHHLMHHKYALDMQAQGEAVRKGYNNQSNLYEIGKKAAEEVPAYRQWFGMDQLNRIERNTQ